MTVKEGVFSSWKGQDATRDFPFRLTAMPRSARTPARSLAALICSIPSFVTCMFPLLLSDGFKGQVFEPSHLKLQKLEVDHGRAAVVVALDLLHSRACDVKDRHPSAVHPADHHLLELASSDQPEGSEEEVIGLEHGFTSFPLSNVDGFEEESWIKVRMVEGSLTLLYSRANVRQSAQIEPALAFLFPFASQAISVENRCFRKILSRPFFEFSDFFEPP